MATWTVNTGREDLVKKHFPIIKS